jgi:hypothetical protein
MIIRANGLLTDESRKKLSQLLGQNIFVLYSTSLDVRADSGYLNFFDVAFAIHPQKKFLTVSPIWEEDNNGDDYGWFEIKIGGNYENIIFDDNGCSTGTGSTITLTPASPISRITLLSKCLFPSDIPSAENWFYHFAIHFEHKERFRYLITYTPNAFTRLNFTFNEDEIEFVRKSAESEEILV